MECAEILKYVAIVENNPIQLYEAIEKAYYPNFLEPAVYKRYNHLFDDEAEEKFKD